MAASKLKYGSVVAVGLIVVGLLLFTGSGSKTHEVLTSPEPLVGDEERSTPGVITTENVVQGQYYARGSNATWTGAGLLRWRVRGVGDVVTYDTNSGVAKVVIKNEQFITNPWKTAFSKDLASVLVSFSPQRLFRSSILARYAVHDAGTGELIRELRTDDHDPNVPQAFQLGVWSNDNKTVFVVYKNDVYAMSARERAAKRLTFDGSEAIFNGIADWVFEEEIFVTTSTCVYPSRSGGYVAYLKFNDTVVEQINYNLYGDYVGEPYFDEYYQYPRFGTVRYPKSGRSNPTVTIHVYKIGDSTCWQATPEHATYVSCAWDISLNALMTMLTSTVDNFIIGQFQWLEHDEHSFSLLVFNRVQNKSWILECSTLTRSCKVIRSNEQSNGWIDNAPLFYHNGAYVTLSSVPQSDGNEYMHVGRFSSELVRMFTRGYYSVDEIVQITKIGDTDVLIFKAPLIGMDGHGNNFMRLLDASQSHYYATKLEMGSVPVCLSCYGECTYNTAKFKGNQFVNTCEREKHVSQVHLMEIQDDLSVKMKLVLEENKALDAALQALKLPEVTYLTVPYKLGGKVYNMSVKVIGPQGWKEAGTHKYPVVVDTYSGPNSQKVNRRLTPNDWSYSLASNPHTPVVYVIVDGIGSGRQSSSLAFEVYRNLGDKEIHDKIYAMKYMLANYKTLDPQRTLIWGWSYGGYVSAMTMGKDTENVFKCGISVAPVVNWYYYDTMYTERYMSTPSDNPEGYNSSNVLRYVDNFASKKYLLVHGNADDNVHYQQSMVLARALEQKAILFRLMSYPDENHSLGGVRSHLFKTLEDFVFSQCFSTKS